MFAFENFNDADYFLKNNLEDGQQVIYECEVEDPQPIARVVITRTKDKMAMFWQEGPENVFTMKAQAGAVTGTSITVLREA